MTPLDDLDRLTFDDVDEWLEVTPTFILLEVYIIAVELILIGTVHLYQYIGLIKIIN